MRVHLWRAVFLQGRLFCPALSMQPLIFVLLILMTATTPGSYFKINLCFTRYSGLMHCGTRNDPFYTNHNDATHQNTIAYNRIERIP